MTDADPITPTKEHAMGKKKKFDDEPLTAREVQILEATAFEIARRKDRRNEGGISSRVDHMLDEKNDGKGK